MLHKPQAQPAIHAILLSIMIYYVTQNTNATHSSYSLKQPYLSHSKRPILTVVPYCSQYHEIWRVVKGAGQLFSLHTQTFHVIYIPGHHLSVNLSIVMSVKSSFLGSVIVSHPPLNWLLDCESSKLTPSSSRGLLPTN